MPRFLRLALLIGVGAVVALFAMQAPDALSDPGSIASAIFFIILLVWILRSDEIFDTSIGAAIRNGLLWVGILGALVVGYEYRYELRQSALRVSSALQPGQPISVSPDETILTRGPDNHFVALADIDGEQVRMLVDTGATDIALPYRVAERIGLDMDNLAFIQPVMTANGSAMVAPVRLKRVRIGEIELTNVSASVAERGRLGSALLGMSFLGRLSEFSFRGDRMVLRR